MANVHSISCPEMKLTLQVGSFGLWQGKDASGAGRMEILAEFLRATKGKPLVYHGECDDGHPLLDGVYLEDFQPNRDYVENPVIPCGED